MIFVVNCHVNLFSTRWCVKDTRVLSSGIKRGHDVESLHVIEENFKGILARNILSGTLVHGRNRLHLYLDEEGLVMDGPSLAERVPTVDAINLATVTCLVINN